MKMELLKRIAMACGESRPTKANTSAEGTSLRYKSSIKNGASCFKATTVLNGLGFTGQHVKSTEGSTNGDFSSDTYGMHYSHPNGTWVCVSADFTDKKPTFYITIHGDEGVVAEMIK